MISLIKQAFSLLFAYKSECANGKNPFRSKTMWANFLGIVAGILSKYAGIELSAGDILILLAVVNMGLRMITKEPVGFYEEKK